MQTTSHNGISSNLKKWLQLKKLLTDHSAKIVLLAGPVATGKSTLIELFKKFIRKDELGGKKSLTISNKGTYVLDGVINPKTIKPMTIQPEWVKIVAEGKTYILIEMPSTIYKPLDNKRPNLDKIINMSSLINISSMSDSLDLMFLVDVKNTGSKVDVWDKSYKTILDMCSTQITCRKTQSTQNNDVKGVHFLITKNTPQIDQKTCINRTDNLLKTLQEQKPSTQVQIQIKENYKKILNHIKENQNVITFNKTTQEEQNTKENIEQIFQYIKGKMSKQGGINLKESKDTVRNWFSERLSLNKEETDFVEEYHSHLKKILTFLDKNFFNPLFTDNKYQDYNTFFKQQFLPACRNAQFLEKVNPTEKAQNLQTNQYIFYSEVQAIANNQQIMPEQSCDNKFSFDNILGIIKAFFRIKEILSSSQLDNQESQLSQSLFPVSADGAAQQHLSQSYSSALIPTTSKILFELWSMLPKIQQQSSSDFGQNFVFYQRMLEKLSEFVLFEYLVTPLLTNWTFRKIQDILRKSFTQILKPACQIIIRKIFSEKSFDPNQSQTYYDQYEQILGDLIKNLQCKVRQGLTRQQKQQLETLKQQNDILMNYRFITSIDLSKPKQALSKIWKFYIKNKQQFLKCSNGNNAAEQSESSKNIQYSFYQELARVLIKLGYYLIPVDIFTNYNMLYSAKYAYDQLTSNKYQCMLSLKKNNNEEQLTIQTGLKNLQLLQSMALLEQCRQLCYKLGDFFPSSRQQLNKKLSEYQKKQITPKKMNSTQTIPEFSLSSEQEKFIEKIIQNNKLTEQTIKENQ